ncbi:GNAT family N-acetyltransferase [Streptomyces roseoverticillatus]|uniref:GNAT family N-acetyltransferase n=1 Tax=Streptomyces roseoverticillatus TaxID=66429 RepID=A0ABV3J4D8_9ACTN
MPGVLPGSRVRVATASGSGRIPGFAALEDDMLEHLYLHPDSRRQVIGSALLAQVREAAPGALSLHVFQRNEAAIAPGRRFHRKPFCRIWTTTRPDKHTRLHTDECVPLLLCKEPPGPSVC